MSAFKYEIFFLTFFVGIPLGFIACFLFPKLEKLVLGLAVFFTSRMNETINFISYETYRGTTRGLEISIIDLLSIVMALLAIKDYLVSKRKISILPPFSIHYLIYFLFSVASIINSDSVMISSFEVLKMVRMYFVYWAFYNFLNTEEKLRDFIVCVSIVMFYVFGKVLFDKYFMGIFQAKGPFPHQNTLVMYTIIFSNILYSKFMESTGLENLVYGILSAACMVIVISSLSRAGMACFGLSIAINTFFHLSVRAKTKKYLKTAVIAFGAFLVLAKSIDSIIQRFETAPKESAETRVLLAESAINMANSNFLGVGLNNFGMKVNYPYPYSKHMPHYYDTSVRGALVETVYLMVAAETGWFNLGIFVLLLLRVLFKAFRLIFQTRKKVSGYMAIAVTSGLVGIYLESTLEWVLRQTTNFYQLMIMIAFIGALAKLLKSQELIPIVPKHALST